MKFYRYNICGNLADLVNIGAGKLKCCEKIMIELILNVTDAAKGKHTPIAKFDGKILNVKVGSIPHSMIQEHYILIYAIIENKVQRVELKLGEKPEASFIVDDAKKVQIFAYCNLHGLWMSEIKR